ncbi:Transcriptional adapter ada2 [Blyttiomyces sp. JEL0837]|nr:Transcriptional adapter ada2 [Blyttiomyces sp. JEL0837]
MHETLKDMIENEPNDMEEKRRTREGVTRMNASRVLLEVVKAVGVQVDMRSLEEIKEEEEENARRAAAEQARLMKRKGRKGKGKTKTKKGKGKAKDTKKKGKGKAKDTKKKGKRKAKGTVKKRSDSGVADVSTSASGSSAGGDNGAVDGETSGSQSGSSGGGSSSTHIVQSVTVCKKRKRVMSPDESEELGVPVDSSSDGQQHQQQPTELGATSDTPAVSVPSKVNNSKKLRVVKSDVDGWKDWGEVADSSVLASFCFGFNKVNGDYVVTPTKSGAPRKSYAPTTTDLNKLADPEIQVCEILSLNPTTYLRIKDTLLKGRFHQKTFKKRAAQDWCRADVSKVGKIYDWFLSMGWLVPPIEDKVGAE